MLKALSNRTPRVALGSLLVCVAVAGCGLGSSPDADPGEVAHRVEEALGETGTPPALQRCLVVSLEDHLTDANAEAALGDLSSNPEASDRSLNSVALRSRAVESRLVRRSKACRVSLVRHRRYSPAEVDRMYRVLGERGFGVPSLFAP